MSRRGRPAHAAGTTACLDELLPRWHFNELHTLRIAASPERVWQALHALRAGDLPLVGLLLALRRLDPAALRGARDRPVLASLSTGGFLELAGKPGRELVFGIVGQFWRLRPRPVTLQTPLEFTSFQQPGFAKAAMDFRILDTAPGTGAHEQTAEICWLSTETRILATDEATRRVFGRYWFCVQPGSALIRLLWLRAVRRRAEA